MIVTVIRLMEIHILQQQLSLMYRSEQILISKYLLVIQQYNELMKLINRQNIDYCTDYLNLYYKYFWLGNLCPIKTIQLFQKGNTTLYIACHNKYAAV
ncbi:unnamed protein product [Paramecium pentaurelia]|uniref:Uncharacterized protein n=1 Tax=Paramecium pentaurelia TaxID=43138 RepID=A0A8S1YIE3_9CILI|nr:unnamed protein product [Paramecium pentaurelia]